MYRLLLVAVIFSSYSNSAFSDLRSNASSWLAAFDPVPSDTPRVERVQAIFKKIKRVTRGAHFRVKLYVINSNSEPWAVALQDGNVILSRGAIDVIYDGSDLESSDARMAFVLGHELAHIIANDFWHQQVYAGFLENETGSTIQTQQHRRRRQEQELKADEEGFIYASLAGFNTQEIFSSVGGEKDFMHHWAKQTSTVSGENYHSPAERIEFLKDRLSELHESVEFFRYGVKLAHFGRYEDALLLLDEFYKTYRSKQVLTNLGYVYIQLARKKMSSDQAYRFWIPTILEYSAGLPQEVRSLSKKLPAAAKENLLTAVELLEAGTASDNTDIVGRINLIAAYLYLGKFEAARLILSEALESREDNPQLLALKSLVILEQDEEDRWSADALGTLEQLASVENADENIVYNYARSLEERGRHGKASRYWKKLRERNQNIPVNYQFMVCKERRRADICSEAIEGTRIVESRMSATIGPGEDTDDRKTRKKLKQWSEPLAKKTGPLDAKIYTHPNGDSLLAIDNIVELVTVKQHGYTFKQQLKDESGQPLVEIPMAADYVWSYGPAWSALIRGEEVEEIWVAQ